MRAEFARWVMFCMAVTTIHLVSSTTAPTVSPTSSPTYEPSTTSPTRHPTHSPTLDPTATPTTMPTLSPSFEPTLVPTANPTTASPTRHPTHSPTLDPTATPTTGPTLLPTVVPSTTSPSRNPTLAPTYAPTVIPTLIPSATPTFTPTYSPTVIPTMTPSTIPSFSPTRRPSVVPSPAPTSQPSAVPSSQPSGSPTSFPTSYPTAEPSMQPISLPTSQPSSTPSSQPSGQPTTAPTLATSDRLIQCSNASECENQNATYCEFFTRNITLLCDSASTPCAFDAKTFSVSPNTILNVQGGCELKVTASDSITIGAQSTVKATAINIVAGASVSIAGTLTTSGQGPHDGPGAPPSTADAVGWGGSYGGSGGSTLCNNDYFSNVDQQVGDINVFQDWPSSTSADFNAAMLGSGGGGSSSSSGDNVSGRGGGRVVIDCQNGVVELTDSGSISADGSSASNSSLGAGSGGSVSILAGVMMNAGTISACGGDATSTATTSAAAGAAGGGGRIAVSVTTGTTGAILSSALRYHGGAIPASSSNVCGVGGAGTVYLEIRSDTTTTAGVTTPTQTQTLYGAVLSSNNDYTTYSATLLSTLPANVTYIRVENSAAVSTNDSLSLPHLPSCADTNLLQYCSAIVFDSGLLVSLHNSSSSGAVTTIVAADVVHLVDSTFSGKRFTRHSFHVDAQSFLMSQNSSIAFSSSLDVFASGEAQVLGLVQQVPQQAASASDDDAYYFEDSLFYLSVGSSGGGSGNATIGNVSVMNLVVEAQDIVVPSGSQLRRPASVYVAPCWQNVTLNDFTCTDATYQGSLRTNHTYVFASNATINVGDAALVQAAQILLCSPLVHIGFQAMIDTAALGCAANSGYGRGGPQSSPAQTGVNLFGGGGAGHGGAGGIGFNAYNGGAAYSAPNLLSSGSGGGCFNCSQLPIDEPTASSVGGGFVNIVANRSFILYGNVSTKGGDAVAGAGGGSGGTVSINAMAMEGSGYILAQGGKGGASEVAPGGGGAGGLISIFNVLDIYTAFSFDGYISVDGGAAGVTAPSSSSSSSSSSSFASSSSSTARAESPIVKTTNAHGGEVGASVATAGSEGITYLPTCSAGYASNAETGTVCSLCPVGTYSLSDNTGECLQCNNAPEHSFYTKTGYTGADCPYQCDPGYSTVHCYNPIQNFVYNVVGVDGLLGICIGVLIVLFGPLLFFRFKRTYGWFNYDDQQIHRDIFGELFMGSDADEDFVMKAGSVASKQDKYSNSSSSYARSSQVAMRSFSTTHNPMSDSDLVNASISDPSAASAAGSSSHEKTPGGGGRSGTGSGSAVAVGVGVGAVPRIGRRSSTMMGEEEFAPTRIRSVKLVKQGRRQEMRLMDQDLIFHACRINFLGSNHPWDSYGGSWRLPLSRPVCLRPMLRRDEYRAFAEKINRRMEWKPFGIEMMIFYIVGLVAPPLAAFIMSQFRQRRAALLLRLISSYDHACFRCPRQRHSRNSLRMGISPDATLAYLDFLFDEDHFKPRTRPLCPLGQVKFPAAFKLAGLGTYYSPYYVDTNDLILQAVPQTDVPSSFINDAWITFVVELNKVLRGVQSDSLHLGLYKLIRFLSDEKNTANLGGVEVHFCTLANTEVEYLSEAQTTPLSLQEESVSVRFSAAGVDDRFQLSPAGTPMHSVDQFHDGGGGGGGGTAAADITSRMSAMDFFLRDSFGLATGGRRASEEGGQNWFSNFFDRGGAETGGGGGVDSSGVEMRNSTVANPLSSSSVNTRLSPAAASQQQQPQPQTYPHLAASTAAGAAGAAGAAAGFERSGEGRAGSYYSSGSGSQSHISRSQPSLASAGVAKVNQSFASRCRACLRALLFCWSALPHFWRWLTSCWQSGYDPVDPTGKLLGFHEMCNAIREGKLSLGVVVTHPKVAMDRYIVQDEDYDSADDAYYEAPMAEQLEEINEAAAVAGLRLDSPPILRPGKQQFGSFGELNGNAGGEAYPTTSASSSSVPSSEIDAALQKTYGHRAGEMQKFYNIMKAADSSGGGSGAIQQTQATPSSSSSSHSSGTGSGDEGDFAGSAPTPTTGKVTSTKNNRNIKSSSSERGSGTSAAGTNATSGGGDAGGGHEYTEFRPERSRKDTAAAGVAVRDSDFDLRGSVDSLRDSRSLSVTATSARAGGRDGGSSDAATTAGVSAVSAPAAAATAATNSNTSRSTTTSVGVGVGVAGGIETISMTRRSRSSDSDHSQEERSGHLANASSSAEGSAASSSSQGESSSNAIGANNGNGSNSIHDKSNNNNDASSLTHNAVVVKGVTPRRVKNMAKPFQRNLTIFNLAPSAMQVDHNRWYYFRSAAHLPVSETMQSTRRMSALMLTNAHGDAAMSQLETGTGAMGHVHASWSASPDRSSPPSRPSSSSTTAGGGGGGAGGDGVDRDSMVVDRSSLATSNYATTVAGLEGDGQGVAVAAAGDSSRRHQQQQQRLFGLPFSSASPTRRVTSNHTTSHGGDSGHNLSSLGMTVDGGNVADSKYTGASADTGEANRDSRDRSSSAAAAVGGDSGHNATALMMLGSASASSSLAAAGGGKELSSSTTNNSSTPAAAVVPMSQALAEQRFYAMYATRMFFSYLSSFMFGANIYPRGPKTIRRILEITFLLLALGDMTLGSIICLEFYCVSGDTTTCSDHTNLLWILLMWPGAIIITPLVAVAAIVLGPSGQLSRIYAQWCRLAGVNNLIMLVVFFRYYHYFADLAITTYPMAIYTVSRVFQCLFVDLYIAHMEKVRYSRGWDGLHTSLFKTKDSKMDVS